MIFLFWPDKFQEIDSEILSEVSRQNLSHKMFGLLSPGFQATPKSELIFRKGMRWSTFQ